jgi:hypothetical protein
MMEEIAPLMEKLQEVVVVVLVMVGILHTQPPAAMVDLVEVQPKMVLLPHPGLFQSVAHLRKTFPQALIQSMETKVEIQAI